MHISYRGPQLPHHSPRLPLREGSPALQQFPAREQLHHEVGVSSVVVDVDQFHYVLMALTNAQQTLLAATVHSLADDLHGIFLLRLAMTTPQANREATVAQSWRFPVQFIGLEECGFFKVRGEHIGHRRPLRPSILLVAENIPAHRVVGE